jgi:hypothetical protein
MIDNQLQEEVSLVSKLSAKLGRIQSHEGRHFFRDGSPVPDEAVAEARREVKRDIIISQIKQETSRRIFAVTKNLATQVNIAAWLAMQTDKSSEDARLAAQLFEWIAAMRETSRTLYDRDDYRSFRQWPAPPPNIKQLIDRF